MTAEIPDNRMHPEWKRRISGSLLLALLAVPLHSCGLSNLQQLSGGGGSEFGFIDKTGKLVIPKTFRQVGSFSGGLAPAAVTKANAKMGATDYLSWGFIDRTGKFVIEPKFDDVLPFREKRAAVRAVIDPNAPGNMYGYGPELGSYQQGRAWGFIDSKGKMVIPAEFEAIGSFEDGLAPARKGEAWGFIGTDGKFVIKPKFKQANNFSEGLAPACVDELWGYIDKKGDFVIAPAFTEANVFSDGAAMVRVGGKCGIINKTGHFIVEPKYKVAHPLSDGLAPIESNISGISAPYDPVTKKFAIASGGGYVLYNTCEYKSEVPHFSAFIDGSGKVVVTPQEVKDNDYVRLGPFSDGLATCESGTVFVRTGYVDNSGKMVIPMQFQTALPFSEGLAAVGYEPPQPF